MANGVSLKWAMHFCICGQFIRKYASNDNIQYILKMDITPTKTLGICEVQKKEDKLYTNFLWF